MASAVPQRGLGPHFSFSEALVSLGPVASMKKQSFGPYFHLQTPGKANWQAKTAEKSLNTKSKAVGDSGRGDEVGRSPEPQPTKKPGRAFCIRDPQSSVPPVTRSCQAWLPPSTPFPHVFLSPPHIRLPSTIRALLEPGKNGCSFLKVPGKK